MIIALAVLVAGIRIGEILSERIEDFRSRNLPLFRDGLHQSNLEFFGGKLPDGFEEKQLAGFDEQVKTAFDKYIKDQVDRFKNMEIKVLIIGTITNGFGDWFITLFKSGAFQCA